MESILKKTTERLWQENDEGNDTIFNEKQWEWSFLRKKCQNLELEPFIETYLQRLRSSYLTLFIATQFLVVFGYTLLLLSATMDKEHIYFDITVYIVSSIVVWLVLAITYNAKLMKRCSWIMYFCSWLAITILVTADISVILYHDLNDHVELRPAFPSYILYVVYMFIPLPDNIHVIILGITVTVSYMVAFALITYREHTGVQKIAIEDNLLRDGVFLVCVNMLGIFTRLTREIAIRTTFLDRRQCIEENLLLRYARNQEKNLLLSILPAQIANKIEQDVKRRIEQLKSQAPQTRPAFSEERVNPTSNIKRWRQPDMEKLFVEPHNDVSILYADLVNYTHLTTTLDVKTLVETIHDLFVKFDTASKIFNVLRIKFLGDCYYCVSGVPVPNEYHAKCCTDLGLCMIRDIRDIRTKRKLKIDMRIGVHSGNILSGVIGALKWQYDIWSKDVDIASRLESTGVAGRVHVSEQTLKMLDGEYMYEEGTAAAREDEVLKKYGIRSFLIRPPKLSIETRMSASEAVRRQIETGLLSLEGRLNVADAMRRQIETGFLSLERRLSTANAMRREFNTGRDDLPVSLTHNKIIQYSQIRTQATLEMSREMDKMPISRIQFLKMCFGRSERLTQDEMEEQNFRNNITSLLLFFKNWRWEKSYLKEPDAMFKYSILFGFFTFVCIIVIQCASIPQSVLFWYLVGVAIFFFVIVITIAWYRKLWIMSVGETDSSIPTNKYSLLLFRISEKLQENVIARVIIYAVMLLFQCGAIFLQMTGCSTYLAENDELDVHIYEMKPFIYKCFLPWNVTCGMVLIICIIFIFTRTIFVLKLALGTFIVFSYSFLVGLHYDFIYERSETTNMDLIPEMAHIMAMVIALIIFHLMERQTEFISKVDYHWKWHLKKKQEDAKFTNETIKILIHNILPMHVADIYLTKQMKNELYYEEYENVAVMFASIRNYNTENVGLRVLNEIICDFDEILSSYNGALKIEKIKVVGWTYMAACGLDIERSENTAGQASYRSSSLLPNGRRSQHSGLGRDSQESILSSDKSDISIISYNNDITPPHEISSSERSSDRYDGHKDMSNRRNRKISSPQNKNVVYVMTQFALDLMRTLRNFNTENLQVDKSEIDHGMLRIGISNGEIMAGVVGSYKPHYDIWGNAVNMASRMDSTGVPGSIQVTKNTAKILKSFGIHCYYRGMTFVKGRGKTPTYFIAIDKDLNFTRKENNMDDIEEGEPKWSSS